MTDHLEDLIAKEANRQGIRINADGLRQATVDLAGSVLTGDGLIAIPSLGSISAADFVRSLHSQAPESFAPLNADTPAKPVDHTGSTLTQRYAAEIAANRGKRRIDASKFTGLTRQYIEENQGKKQ